MQILYLDSAEHERAAAQRGEQVEFDACARERGGRRIVRILAPRRDAHVAQGRVGVERSLERADLDGCPERVRRDGREVPVNITVAP